MTGVLVPLPPHPDGAPWPTSRWDWVVLPASWCLDAAVAEMLDDRERFGDTHAVAIEAPAEVAAWSTPNDPRNAVTLDHLLAMRDNLDFVEEYDPASERSDVIEMPFGTGQHDVAAFAADRPLAARPRERATATRAALPTSSPPWSPTGEGVAPPESGGSTTASLGS
jgi:hypothetical protein